MSSLFLLPPAIATSSNPPTMAPRHLAWVIQPQQRELTLQLHLLFAGSGFPFVLVARRCRRRLPFYSVGRDLSFLLGMYLVACIK
jgi:hypothetical protein